MQCDIGIKSIFELEIDKQVELAIDESDVIIFMVDVDTGITSMDKGSFIGLGKLNKMKLSGVRKKLIAFKMLERGIPRQGYKIYINKKLVGYVTSGTQSPKLNVGIGLGYIDIPYNKINQKISIAVRNQFIDGIIIKPPFLKNTSLLY